MTFYDAWRECRKVLFFCRKMSWHWSENCVTFFGGAPLTAVPFWIPPSRGVTQRGGMVPRTPQHFAAPNKTCYSKNVSKPLKVSENFEGIMGALQGTLHSSLSAKFTRKCHFVHQMVVHNFGAPLSPSPAQPAVMDSLLNLCCWKDLKQNCQHSTDIANKLSQICEESFRQTRRKSRQKKFMNFTLFLCILVSFLRKTSTLHIDILFQNAPVTSSRTDLSLVWFARATPEFVQKQWTNRRFWIVSFDCPLRTFWGHLSPAATDRQWPFFTYCPRRNYYWINYEKGGSSKF